jgi:Tol biopolymer transport system component
MRGCVDVFSAATRAAGGSIALRSGLTVALVLVQLLVTSRAPAMTCDAIKNLGNDSFDGVLGAITRPALIPGFPAEVIVNPAVCGNQTRSQSPGFTIPVGCDNDSTPCPPRPVEQFQVNIVFTPAVGGSHMVVMREDCSSLDLSACSIPDERVLCLERPDTSPPRFDVRSRSLPSGSELRLQFTTPDTTSFKGVPLAGSATFAVSLASDPPPCDLATTLCKDFRGALVSCADDLFKRDSTCSLDDSRIDPNASNLVVLPPPSRFVDLCAAATDPSGECLAPTGIAPAIPFTQNKVGDLFTIIDMRDVLVRTPDGTSFPRKTRAALALKGAVTPLDPPNSRHYVTRSPTYARINPIFDPVKDPARPGEIFGTTDAAFHLGVGSAHSCSNDPETPCSADSVCEALACPGGGTCDKTCSVERLTKFCVTGGEPHCTLGGAGAIQGECLLGADGVPRCQLGGTVTLDALASSGLTDQVVVAPVNECVGQTVEVQTERNADPDQHDVIVTLLDRAFGFELRPIGSGGAEGRAETRVVDQEPFSFTTSVFEGPVAAFLETEFGECDPASAGDCDQNADGVLNHGLRAFRLDAAGVAPPEDLLAAPDRRIGPGIVEPPSIAGLDVGVQTPGGFRIAAEPSLNVNLTPVEVSEGLVFFRTPRDPAPRSLSLVSAESDQASLSPEGRFVAFTTASALSGDDKNRARDVYVRDLEAGGVSLASAKIRDSCLERPRPGDGPSGEAAASANAGFVAYSSDSAKQLDRPKGPPQDTNGVTDVFVFERSTCNVKRASRRTDGGQPNGRSFAPSISGDGSLVAFVSLATNLDPLDTTADPDVYLHDRTTGQTRLVSAGTAAAGAVSTTAGSVVYQSDGPAAGADDTDVLVDDGSGVVEASVSSDGVSAELGAFDPFVSASGRFVVFTSAATGLVEGGANGQPQVFAHDLQTGETLQAGMRRAPRQCVDATLPEPLLPPDGIASGPAISEDGRHLFYSSTSSNLVPGGAGVRQVFAEDLKTGTVVELSLDPRTGVAGSLASSAVGISSDGSIAAFETLDAGLAGGRSGAPNLVLTQGGFGKLETVLGVLDTTAATPTLSVLDVPVDFIKVANGAAIFVAEGENVKLFRRGPTGFIVEDLLRPGVSAADAIAIDANHACALVDEPGGPRPACHEIGTPPASSLDDIAPPGVTASSIQVSGTSAAFTERQADGSLLLHGKDLTSAAPAVPIQAVEDFVLGEVACFRTSELVTGDQNGDGRSDATIMFVDDLADQNDPVSCRFSASRCDLAPCDPRVPYVTIERTCKFVTDEEVRALPSCLPDRDLNLDGECTDLMRRCTLGFENTEVVLGSITALNLTGQSANPLTTTDDVVVGSACVALEAPDVPVSACPCDPPQVCSGPFTLTCADSDRDGVCDRDDVCVDVPNPDPVDFDGDGVPDECDAFVCGNGELESAELCDFSVNPVGCTPFCTQEPPQVDISEQSVNPGKGGVLPGVLLSNAGVNLDVVARDGLPPRMVATESLRMAAVVDGVCPGALCVGGSNDGVGCSENADCTGGFCDASGKVCVAAGSLDGTTCSDDSDCGSGTCGGTPLSQDLTTDTAYAGKLVSDKNGDGFVDLTVHFGVSGSGISATTVEACVKGAFRVSLDPSRPAEAQTFVVKDGINVN